MRRSQSTSRSVTPRTAARRARRRVAAEIEQHTQRTARVEPETLSQAKVWDRKNKRYLIAGLCPLCASQAAWGHSIGFQKIKDPCTECQPLVDAFDTPGPRGSKWRKCLVKLEYLKDKEAA